MMHTFKKLYREFFRISEQTANVEPGKDVIMSTDDIKDPKKVQAAQTLLKTTKGQIRIESTDDSDIEEAKLDNSISEYRGGVEYVLLDPATAKQTAASITKWTERKGFVILKQQISKTGRVGYFYFKLGDDPAAESQKIQGYFSQRPDLKHFRFNVRTAPPVSKKQSSGKF
jgi:hypothetical protein